MPKQIMDYETGKIVLKIEGDQVCNMDTISIDVIIAGQKVGSVFVDLLKDSENIEGEHYDATDLDEWLIQYQRNGEEDPRIISQGNI